MQNNLNYEFAYTIHAGEFSGLIEPIEEPPTRYEPEETTRTENVILE